MTSDIENFLRDGLREAIENHKTKRIQKMDELTKHRCIEAGVEAWKKGNCSFSQAKKETIQLAELEASRERK